MLQYLILKTKFADHPIGTITTAWTKVFFLTKKLTKMKHTLRISALFFLVFILFTACNRKATEAEPLPTNISDYIHAYTTGSISKAAAVRVRLTAPLIEKENVGSILDGKVFNIKPSVKGTATWEDEQTIIFQPEEELQSNTHYLAQVYLDKIYPDLPKEVRSFEFNFYTREQHFYISWDGLQNDPAGNEKKKQYKGTLHTIDVAEAGEVEKILTAKQGSNSLPIKWQHSTDQLRHSFLIENIQRGDNASEVNLSWNGKYLDLKKDGEKQITIPALGDFKVLDSKVIQGSQPHIVLYFSDPLNSDQDLRGLVTIKGYNGELEYLTDGNQLRIYPKSQGAGEWTVKAAAGIKSAGNNKMKSPSEWKLYFEQAKPRVRLVGNGVVMPNSDGLMFPFEAINLNFVDVEVLKIFNNNILQFLQNNEIDGEYNLNQVGRIIKQKQVKLTNLNADAKASRWNRYALDLSDLIKDDPYAIYQVSLGFRQNYSTYSCTSDENPEAENTLVEDPFMQSDGNFLSIWRIRNTNYEGYEWDHRNDPCYPAYFSSNKFVRRNVLASDMGILAKRGSGQTYMLAVTDLRTTLPMPAVMLEVYDYQQQLMKTISTDGQGMASVELKDDPFVVVANRGDQKGYLKLMDQQSLSLSRFDTGGSITQSGLKGFMYGERGVWRPGDSIYLNFVLEDKEGKLPVNHPVTFELFDARGQLKERRTVLENVKNVYPLHVATSADAPTGNWRAVAKVGGANFSKTLKVETVKPNRLKIKMDFGKEKFTAADEKLSGDLQVNWLHGAPASNLKAKVEMQLKSVSTSFKGYNQYSFKDPTKRFDQEPMTVFDGSLDDDGFAKVTTDLNVKGAALGKVRASFKTRAFEKGGDFSADNFSVNYDPFESYAGVHVPRNKYGEARIKIGESGTIKFAALDGDGKAMSNRNLTVGLYRVQWRWWWDSGSDNLMKYNHSDHRLAVEKGNIRTNAKGDANWTVEIDDWGRYMVRVCDTQSGHCSGTFFYAGYPWYDDDDEGDNSQMREAAAMLAFTAEKEKYNVGEEIKLNIPASEAGRCLVSIENGSRVVETYWIDAEKGDNQFSFYAQPEMTPTIYAHVTLIQPHAQVENDLPIRMYGVIPIGVEDEKTRIEPIATMSDELKPDENFSIKISEKSGRAMAYTVAVVDDGLLDLTRFKTPNPWNTFYAREALGVNTWDMYDQVMGAYGGRLENVLSIGGDGEVNPAAGDKKANRFKPVVMHLGPFFLEKGQSVTHELKMPNYVGSVRTMVVASHEGAYGNFEKTTPVKKPLMMLATLPRVLGPGETLKLPVNIFAMDKKIKNVSVSIEETSGLVNMIGGNTQQLSFSKVGDDLATFDIKVGERVGVAKFRMKATGAGEVATQEIEIQVRNPNPMVTEVTEKVLQAGETWEPTFSPVGIMGTNSGTLEISNIPPIDLGKRLNYLIRYPHGCIEQTTSSGFPQLYVNKLLDLDQKKERQVEKNIKATLKRLKKFQTSGGGFAYWPGNRDPSMWGTNYGGHFMLEAKALGYNLPIGLLDRWISFQKKEAKKWTNTKSRDGDRYSYGIAQHQLMQAYRLYVLALAGEPQMGAMNQLREIKKLNTTARWRLALAYAEAGKSEIADQLVNGLGTEIEDYVDLGYSYGSSLRDEAMILETLNRIDQKDKAGGMAKRISEKISEDRWYNTQAVAYCLLAVGKFLGDNSTGDKFTFTYKIGNGQKINGGSSKPLMHLDVLVDGNSNKSISVKNTTERILYTRLILSGKPLIGDEKEEDSNLRMNITYKDMKGKEISPKKLAQGTDFIAEVKIINPGYRYRLDEMALNQIFPSGWEIHNSRMSDVNTFSNLPTGQAGTTVPEYQDIRDDRVMTYFDIWNKKPHTYRVQLNAAYQGKYYLPTVYCEAMYDNNIFSRKPGQWIEVTAPSGGKADVNIEAAEEEE